jgi:hypothetical protein
MSNIDKVKKQNELLENTVGKFRNFILSGVVLHIYSIYYAISQIEFEKPVNDRETYYIYSKKLLKINNVINVMNILFLLLNFTLLFINHSSFNFAYTFFMEDHTFLVDFTVLSTFVDCLFTILLYPRKNEKLTSYLIKFIFLLIIVIFNLVFSLYQIIIIFRIFNKYGHYKTSYYKELNDGLVNITNTIFKKLK